MKPLQVLRKEVTYKNQYQQIYRVLVDYGRFTKEFFVNDYGRRVGLIFVRDVDVLLVRQYRLLAQAVAWEIPGGRVDEGETPEEGAIREGLEETCFRCKSLKPLLYFHPGLDTFDNPTFLFYCDDFEAASDEHFHSNEISDRVWLPLSKCIEMIFAREIVDSLSIAALLAYKTLRDNPQLGNK